MASRIDRDRPASGPLVQGFGARGIVVDGRAFAGVLMTPATALAWDAPALDALGIDHLAPLLAMDPPAEFILLGTGPAMAFAPPALVTALDARGIGIEAMDSRAAARTWGVLRAEERWIGAALMPLA